MNVDFTGEFFVPGKSPESLEKEHLERYQFACQYARKKSVLDIACGVGYGAPMLIGAGALSYEGVDINRGNIEYAKQRYSSDRARFSAGDICTFSSEKTYDLIICFETIEHVKDYRAALKNLYNLLNQSGLLLISSPNRQLTSPSAFSLDDQPENKFHCQEFSPEELLAELRLAGFGADADHVYGQMQRRKYANRFKREVARIFYGRPEKQASPKVTPVKNKMPLFFIIVATKM